MRFSRTSLTVLLFIPLTTAAGCGNSTDSTASGLVRLSLTDSPGSFDAVTITVSEIGIHKATEPEGEWKVIPLESQVFDLMTLQNGQTAPMGEKDLEPGVYSQIRLKIETAEVRIGNDRFDLEVPSGVRTGLKINLSGFEVDPGLEYDLVLDFDAARSIAVTGPGTAPTGYKLKPVIRATMQANTGAIRGMLNDATHLPQVFAISDGDTVSSTLVDTVTWEFLLAYLPEGGYTVAVADTTGAGSRIGEVTVATGQIVDVGELILAE